MRFAEGRKLEAWAVCSLMEKEDCEGENPLSVGACVQTAHGSRCVQAACMLMEEVQCRAGLHVCL